MFSAVAFLFSPRLRCSFAVTTCRGTTTGGATPAGAGEPRGAKIAGDAHGQLIETVGVIGQEDAPEEEEKAAILAVREEDADGRPPMPLHLQTRKQLTCLLVVQLDFLRRYRIGSC